VAARDRRCGSAPAAIHAIGEEDTTISARVDAGDPAEWKVTGDLTIHGVTRPVVLDVCYLGQAPGHPEVAAVDRRLRPEGGGHLAAERVLGSAPGSRTTASLMVERIARDVKECST
jgi:hypothetical protein